MKSKLVFLTIITKISCKSTVNNTIDNFTTENFSTEREYKIQRLEQSLVDHFNFVPIYYSYESWNYEYNELMKTYEKINNFTDNRQLLKERVERFKNLHESLRNRLNVSSEEH